MATPSSRAVRLPYVGFANGQRLSNEEFQNLNKDGFDVILDLTSRTLEYRSNPQERSQLEPSPLHGIGPYRIRILTFMMEHPDFPLCSDNVDDRLGDTQRIATSQAFTRSIYVLRQALGSHGRDNPYIQSVPAWESSKSTNARAYCLNPEWQYLLIKSRKSNKSSLDHDPVTIQSES
jgi:hypothetical protein